MTRIAFAFLASLSAVSFARAEEAKIIMVDPGDRAGHAQIVAAAKQVCNAALSHDRFGDFGTQEECVQNTLDDVHPVHAGKDQADRRASAMR
jgi:hypothetical protein